MGRRVNFVQQYDKQRVHVSDSPSVKHFFLGVNYLSLPLRARRLAREGRRVSPMDGDALINFLGYE